MKTAFSSKINGKSLKLLNSPSTFVLGNLLVASLSVQFMVGCNSPSNEYIAKDKAKDKAGGTAAPVVPGPGALGNEPPPVDPGSPDTQTPPIVFNPPGVNTNAIPLDPDTLRTMLLARNTTLKKGALEVMIAKDQVNLARADLTPKLNLGVLLASAANPMFLLSSVEVLLPFLLPSKWFDLFQAENLLEAQKAAYRLVKINEYASAYSIYYAILGDTDLQSILNKEAADYAMIQTIVEGQYRSFLVNMTQVNEVKGERALAEVLAIQVSQLLTQEKGFLKQALGLTFESDLALKNVDVPASIYEDQPIQDTLGVAIARSPEALQLKWLIEASKNERWSKMFGFITGASIKTSGGPGGVNGKSFAFNNMMKSTTLSFGLNVFPEMDLTDDHCKQIVVRREELRLEFSMLLEVALTQLLQSREIYRLTQEAEASFQQVYDTAWTNYKFGLGNLITVLQARQRLFQAEIQSMKARNQLNLIRITLHRIMMTDQFELVDKSSNPVVKKPQFSLPRMPVFPKLFQDNQPEECKTNPWHR